MGYYYEISQDARQERAQAVYWYGKAAERGHAQAQFKLGHCYETGIGTQQDWTQAVYWYGKAAEQGYIDAQNKLNECCGESTPKEEKGGEEDKPVSPFVLILQIIIFAFGAVAPFVYPEVTGLTPVCQLIIVCLYGFAVVIAVVYDRISKRARSVMLWLYFVTRAASIAFGFLVLGASLGTEIIICPFMFWLLILWVETCKDNWQNWQT